MGPRHRRLEQEPFSIAVNLNLVTLQASVHDRHGRDVTNLRQQDFALYEDGVRQNIRLFRREDAPVTVGLVVDHWRQHVIETGRRDAGGVTVRTVEQPERRDVCGEFQ